MNELLKFRVPATLALTMLAIGTVFYHFNEGFSWLDSIYFCVVTLGTVGYGDLHPTNPISKIFTIFYILIGVGILVSFFSSLTSRFVERRTARQERRHMEK